MGRIAARTAKGEEEGTKSQKPLRVRRSPERRSVVIRSQEVLSAANQHIGERSHRTSGLKGGSRTLPSGTISTSCGDECARWSAVAATVRARCPSNPRRARNPMSRRIATSAGSVRIRFARCAATASARASSCSGDSAAACAATSASTPFARRSRWICRVEKPRAARAPALCSAKRRSLCTFDRRNRSSTSSITSPAYPFFRRRSRSSAAERSRIASRSSAAFKHGRR